MKSPTDSTPLSDGPAGRDSTHPYCVVWFADARTAVAVPLAARDFRAASMEALNITPEQLKSGSRSEADDGLCQATLEKIAYRVARILRLVGQLPRIPMGTYVPPNKKTHRWFMTCFMAELAYRLEQVLSHLMTFPQDNYPVNDLNLDLDAEADRFPRD